MRLATGDWRLAVGGSRLAAGLLPAGGLLVLVILGALAGAEDRGRLRLATVEGPVGGPERPVAARIHLQGPGGKPVEAPGLPYFHDHFASPGSVELELPPGRYAYTVERGPEWRGASGEVEVEAGKDAERKIRLERWIDLAALGWWCGDLHVHRPPEHMALLLRAEDLHLAPVITVWNRRNLWSGKALPEDLVVQVEPGRAYHLLACEDERQGGALLYLNCPRPLELAGDGPEHPSPAARLLSVKKEPGIWVDLEKPFWWDTPTWVATGKIDSVGIAHNHMNRRGVYPDEAWGRPRDRERFPPPRGNGLYTQEIYYRLLNSGFRIPPSAGSASGVLPNPVGHNRVYARLEGPFSPAAWWRALAAGRVFVTNGPVLLVEANGKPPGEVLSGAAGESVRVTLRVRAEGNEPLEAVEVVRDGAVVLRASAEEVRGGWEPPPLLFERSGWVLVRALAGVPGTFRFASTGPWYVEAGGRPRRVHRSDVEHFLSWIEERIERLRKSSSKDLEPEGRREEVLRPHLEARQVFQKLLEEAR